MTVILVFEQTVNAFTWKYAGKVIRCSALIWKMCGR